MVAITVILAAVIAAFVLDLGQSQGANAQAGLSFDENEEASGDIEVVATVNSVERADSITVEGCGDTKDLSSPSAGDTATLTSNDCSGETITVTGTTDGNENVITQYDVEG
ncbi:Protein of unknown function (DUF1628) [Natrinema pellirubrum DSM 15624]|nr:Protein of unknown function (DUF1628) [Natrinema pellirubrum DSM 15624]